MPFRKYRLLKYKPSPFEPLNSDGFHWILTVEVWTWWGMIKRFYEVEIEIGPHINVQEFYDPILNKWFTRGVLRMINKARSINQHA